MNAWSLGRSASGLALALLLCPGVLQVSAAQNASTAGEPGVPAVFPLIDSSGLKVTGGTAEGAEFQGRKAIRLTTKEEVFAFVDAPAFEDGTIEADIALKITTPPGVRMPGFLGIAFRARADASHYELFYLRPGNSRADDQAMRNHSVQYVSSPGFDWYALRRQWPWVYESWADLGPERWTHVKIEVRGRTARLFLNDAETPSLMVNGLKGEDLRGGIALWGYSGEEAYFANLKITPAAAEPIKNGGEAAGTWEVKLNTDYGRYDGTMTLHREENKIDGMWTGALGAALPVTGRWRNGYVELSFAGMFPGDKPAPVTATMAGWVDGDGARGRVKLEGRADGIWSAERKK